MKKWLSLLLLCLTLSCAAQAAPPPAEMPGKITKITKEKITLLGKNDQEIILVGLENAYIINGATGEDIAYADLKTGMSVTAYHSRAITRSMPPQARTIALIVGRGANMARYFPVAEAVHLSPGVVRVLNTQKSQYLTIQDDVLPYPAQLQAGSELLAWYKISALSMPGQATPSRVRILNKQRPDIVISLSAGVVAAGERREIPLLNPLDQDGNLFLPLREVAEALGYRVSWQAGENAALVQREDGADFKLTVGSRTYDQSGRPLSALILRASPKIANGVLLAPVEVFSILLEHSVQINRESV